uniref:Uncharacterized protein LOC111117263 n=1 Tax=Crassostrea virginica TaxID=6565 RepID=A0A8B8CA76_CRAVI|nr:uncharacterized protein LOC111117263 [Crassostrea virginica]
MLTVTGQATQCVFEAQGTSMTGSSFTESMTKSLLECQSACSADRICLAVTHKSGNNNCRLHDSMETTSFGCADCTYYLKLCASTTTTSNTGRVSQTSISPASGSCTFTSQGPNTRGYAQYSQSQQSLSDCQGSCLHDDLCNGFTHRGSDDTCFLHESPEHQTISCATCTFVSKSCVPLTTTSNTGSVSQTNTSPASGTCTFTSQGTNTRGFVQYSESEQSLSDCQDSCLHDDLCNGFTHRGSDDRCYLHESPEHQTISCATCTFVSKSCVPLTTTSNTGSVSQTSTSPASGSCTFTSQGTNTRGYAHYSQSQQSLSDCQDSCLHDDLCNGFTHLTNDGTCLLHDIPGYKTVSCATCTFVSKSCVPLTTTSNTGSVSQTSTSPASGSCTFTSQGTNTRGYAHYSQSQQSLSDCQDSCLHDDLCNGFTHLTNDGTCLLHDIPGYKTVSCATCTFVSKSCVPLTTTEGETSTLNILDTKEDDWDALSMSSSLVAIDGTTSYSSQLPTETTTAANTPDSYSVPLNKENTTESQMYQGTSDTSSGTDGQMHSTDSDSTLADVSISSTKLTYSTDSHEKTTSVTSTQSDSSSSVLIQDYSTKASTIISDEAGFSAVTYSSPSSEAVSIADNSVGTSTVLSVEATSSISSSSSFSSVTSSEHRSTTAAIVDDSSTTLSVGTLESHSSFHSSPPTIEAEITSTTSPETLSEHVSGSTTNANTYSPSDQTAGAQVETTGADTIETTYTSLFPESTIQHTVSPFDTSTNAPFSNEQTTQSIQHSSPERKTILSESTSSTYVDFSSEVTSEPKTSDSTTNTQLLSSTGTSTNALLDKTTEESTSVAVSTTVSDSETSTLSHVSKTDTTSLVSTAVSTLVFESSTPMPSQHSSESISQNTEQGTITNTNAYFSTEKASQANLDTTTEEPEDDTVVTQITNGTVQCTCVCRTVNRTLEESIELRKKALSVKHKELSSNLRKLTSAPDFRPSSKAMAFVGRAHVADSAEVKSSALQYSPLLAP